MKYEKLFEKGKIGKLTIKNRIVMPPMGTGFAAASGEASEEITRYYEERAKGGVGLIITEVCRVDELSGVAQPCQLRATDMDVIPSFTRMVDVFMHMAPRCSCSCITPAMRLSQSRCTAIRSLAPLP